MEGCGETRTGGLICPCVCQHPCRQQQRDNDNVWEVFMFRAHGQFKQAAWKPSLFLGSMERGGGPSGVYRCPTGSRSLWSSLARGWVMSQQMETSTKPLFSVCVCLSRCRSSWLFVFSLFAHFLSSTCFQGHLGSEVKISQTFGAHYSRFQIQRRPQ